MLLSVVLLLFGLATAWASAAIDAKNAPLEVLFYALQPIWFLIARHDADASLPQVLISIPICSLLYGCGISGLCQLRASRRNRDGA